MFTRKNEFRVVEVMPADGFTAEEATQEALYLGKLGINDEVEVAPRAFVVMRGQEAVHSFELSPQEEGL